MGAYTTDSDSEDFCEKTQTTTAPKQSYCPFVLIRQYRKDRQEKRDQERRTKIENIREQVNKSRKNLKNNQETPWRRATSTEQRREVFEHGVEAGSFRIYGCTYKKGRKCKLTWTSVRGGYSSSVIHDLRTVQGRDEAFKWWDESHARESKAITRSVSRCDSWEARYLEYIKNHDSHLRDLLLKGDPTRWSRVKVEILFD
ncbi:hypothetical protein KVR01_005617 [Diaporthe batatas]|uniref:uncharacterized protein n=1 Tax=Diaporthe batatas TaxID=748121 RepID=UPI001D042BBC|nr:uncharacterized protein KVR01_005617 [Diaporthe batatas]KAG8165342.1 hypothetical protein KVR01_005617 [Diaporthe batatas]